ncbi:MAG: Hsp70 family protein [Planctomycetales bacterium]|nr:Hsp70 family protein [Planctomycetales bacterium]
MAGIHDDSGETREVPIEELMLTAPSASGELPLPVEPEEDDDFSLGPRQPVIGEYVLLRRIGAGGNGRVFKARHRQMERLVALKMLSPATMRDPEAVRRFRREMKAAAKLFHPNIVTAFDAGEHGGVHYLVMEYVEGLSLTMLVERHGPVTVDKAVDYVMQAATGLSYAHSRNVIHRDIKPSNLIMDSDGVVKILDLGTARFENESGPSDLTQTGIIMGTVNYMSPEQARNATEVDHRCDIYSLGCTLHYLLTGRPVFDGNVMQVLMAHAEQPAPSLRESRPEVPSWLDVLFRRMIAKRAVDRQDSMQGLISELTAGLSGQASAESTRFRLQLPSERRPQRPLGVDIGSSKCMIASVQRGEPAVLGRSGAEAVPTAVALSGMNIAVGRPALERVGDTTQVAWRIKRQLGAAQYSHEIDGAHYPPEVLLALILGRIGIDAQGQMNSPFREAVFAVPAGFNDAHRKAVEDVAYIGGVDVVDLINEPTAAMLSLVCDANFSVERPSRMLCVDLGAGKLDVGVYDYEPGRLTTAAIHGVPSLGGDDWDDVLADVMADQIVAGDGPDPRLVDGALREIASNCERAKHHVSAHGEAKLAFNDAYGRILLTVSETRFQQLTAHLIRQVTEEVECVLQQAGCDWSELDRIVLAGQATQAAGVLDALKASAGKTPIQQLPASCVAKGAALQASFQRSRADGRRPLVEVEDAAANSLGLVGIESKTQRRCNAVLIPRGAKLPAATRRTFKTFREGQDSLMIQMLQGEHVDADRCTSVGRCVISDLPPGLPIGTQFDVEFQCAPSGRVTVYVESAAIGFRVTRELVREHALTHHQLARWREWVETMTLCSTLG